MSVLPGVHDGGLRLHQDQHWEGERERDPGRGSGDVPSYQRVSSTHRIQSRIQTCWRNQVNSDHLCRGIIRKRPAAFFFLMEFSLDLDDENIV